MPQLNPSFVAKIREELEGSKFSAQDFNLELPESGKMLVRIAFLYVPTYALALYEEVRSDSVITAQSLLGISHTRKTKDLVHWVRAAPAAVRTEATYDIDDPQSFLREIPKWCDAIRSDLSVVVVPFDPVAELRARLQVGLSDLVTEPDVGFTEAELKTVDARFDKLLVEIEGLQSEHAITKTKLDELNAAFLEFKSTARTYPKGIWARVTANKLAKAVGSIVNSPEGRTFLIQQIKRAIGLGDGAS